MSTEIKKTNCHYCGYLCAFEAHVKDGKVIKLEPDATRYPYDTSVSARCVRWGLNIEKLYDKSRINYPLRRVGKRGSGKFERVSWDEALTDISNKLSKLIKEYGGHTIASCIGGPHAVYWPLHRLMSYVQSPNNMGIGPICWNPRIWMDTMTYGWSIECDLRPGLTGCLILWGTNPAESDNSLFWRNVSEFVRGGGKLIVVDTRLSKTAAKASVWLHPFPGTDIVLAYGLARIIIDEHLCDNDFIDKWCYGFEDFKKAAYSYTLEQVSNITKVSISDMQKAARLYAGDYPSGLLSGRGVDQIGPNTAPLHRVLASLRAITGNVDVPGACCINEAPRFASELELEGSLELSDEAKKHCLNAGALASVEASVNAAAPVDTGVSNQSDCGLQSYSGYALADKRTSKLGKHLPMRYLTSALPARVWNAAINYEPYRVSALIVDAANPLVTYADTNLVMQALEAMELVVVLEFVNTPTAQMADYVLPAAAALEHPCLQAMGGVSDFCYGGAAAIEPQYERREDYQILRDIALRLGDSEKNWPAKNLSEELARMLEPVGMDWDNFCRVGLCGGTPHYLKHEEIDPQTGKMRGFATESGKIELANPFLDSLGANLVGKFQPIDKVHKNLSTDPQAAILITGARKQPYWASSYFEVPKMRARHPKPLLEMSQNTADKLGVRQDDEVLISRLDTPDIEVTQYVNIVKMLDGVVSAEYGWWFPEELEGFPNFSGLFKSNINLLTRGFVEGKQEPLIGTWIYNGIPCRVRKKEC